MITENLKIQGQFRVYQDVDGVRTLVAESTNVITRTAKSAILRSLAQSSAGIKLDGSFFIDHIALCTRMEYPPAPPWDNLALSAFTSAQMYQEIDPAPANVVIGSSSVYIIFNVTWVNPDPGAVTINLLATTLEETGAVGTIFSVSSLSTDVSVPGNNGSVNVEYTLSIPY